MKTEPLASLWRILLNPSHPQARRESQDMHQLHRTLSRTAWQDEDSNDERRAKLDEARILFRVDRGAELWVLSRWPLDWSRVPEGWMRSSPEMWSLDEAPEVGMAYRFTLCCRPSRKSGSSRRDLLEKEEQRAWMLEQGAKKGFSVVGAQHIPLEWVDTKNSAYAARNGARFEGILTCIDSDALYSAMVEGIGPGKSQGFGLLTLSPWAPLGTRLL